MCFKFVILGKPLRIPPWRLNLKEELLCLLIEVDFLCGMLWRCSLGGMCVSQAYD
jgi:hypothetical protein